jgi:hypothetical protein
LSKHFRRDEAPHAGQDRDASPQLDLFGAE